MWSPVSYYSRKKNCLFLREYMGYKTYRTTSEDSGIEWIQLRAGTFCLWLYVGGIISSLYFAPTPSLWRELIFETGRLKKKKVMRCLVIREYLEMIKWSSVSNQVSWKYWSISDILVEPEFNLTFFLNHSSPPLAKKKPQTKLNVSKLRSTKEDILLCLNFTNGF